jgi:hypothetical protein
VFTFTTFNDIARPSRRVEYVGATGGPASWIESGLMNADAFDDPGFVDGQPHKIPAGTAPVLNWFGARWGRPYPPRSAPGTAMPAGRRKSSN